jgi:DNA invertase Pin-like site-specific DNA recombinase
MTIRVAIYARTSPDCPLGAIEQVECLRTIAIDRGWPVANVFTDRPISVRKRQDRRPGEAAMVDAIRNGTIDRVLIWSLCRVGRSLTELVAFLETCRARGVNLYLHDQHIDTAISNGLSLLDVAPLMVHHLRQSRRDRIMRGQATARALSIKFGRPVIPTTKTEKAKRELAAGKGVRQVARMAGISPASVSRIKTSMNATAART